MLRLESSGESRGVIPPKLLPWVFNLRVWRVRMDGECSVGDAWMLALRWVTWAFREDSLPEFAGSYL